MDNFYIPKQDIMTILSGIDGAVAYQRLPQTGAEFPCFSFYINENTPTVDLGKQIGYQSVEVVIDIWSKTSTQCSSLLVALEQAMRSHDWVMTFSADVNDPNGLFHTTSRFYLLA